MDVLRQLMDRCKCGISIEINEHRVYYDSAEERLRQYDEDHECPPEISDAVRSGILLTGNIVDVQCYPDTPVGSYQIVHFDLDTALRLMLDCVRNKK